MTVETKAWLALIGFAGEVGAKWREEDSKVSLAAHGDGRHPILDSGHVRAARDQGFLTSNPDGIKLTTTGTAKLQAEWEALRLPRPEDPATWRAVFRQLPSKLLDPQGPVDEITFRFDVAPPLSGTTQGNSPDDKVGLLARDLKSAPEQIGFATSTRVSLDATKQNPTCETHCSVVIDLHSSNNAAQCLRLFGICLPQYSRNSFERLSGVIRMPSSSSPRS